VRDTAGAQADRDRETVRVRHLYDALAARYDRAIALAERLLFDDGRRWLCAQARGDVLEIAVGTGRNLSFYPPDVRLTGIELSPAMLEIARRHARELGRVADLHVGDAQALAFPNASFDTVVCAIALCTIPDERRAVAEAAPGARTCAEPAVASARRAARVRTPDRALASRPPAARASRGRAGGGT
jgi:ubiquinone/menaquinone biosynthesis C-methylase UbiE